MCVHLLGVAPEQRVHCWTEGFLQRMVADRTLQIRVDRLEQQIGDAAVARAVAERGRRRAVRVQVHALQRNLAFEQRVERHALRGIAQQLQQFADFRELFVVAAHARQYGLQRFNVSGELAVFLAVELLLLGVQRARNGAGLARGVQVDAARRLHHDACSQPKMDGQIN